MDANLIQIRNQNDDNKNENKKIEKQNAYRNKLNDQ